MEESLQRAPHTLGFSPEIIEIAFFVVSDWRSGFQIEETSSKLDLGRSVASAQGPFDGILHKHPLQRFHNLFCGMHAIRCFFAKTSDILVVVSSQRLTALLLYHLKTPV
ncbi:uncharacterized protein LOC120087297 [Benincasa hispida]|uniref:uncharacterized protein LOC120087297 n=1 Tax=Benincasa hispida TaxID=102211 RepID=UPI0018FFE853|nr:uncharacterized protein LOC120087297 [Benincasa hispida]